MKLESNIKRNHSFSFDNTKFLSDISKNQYVKYTLIGAGVLVLIYASGKIMKIMSGTIVEYKNLKNVMRS